MFLSLLDLFLRLYYTLFSMNQNHGEILHPQWSSPIFYPTTKVQNSVMFSPIMSTKCKIFSRICMLTKREIFSWSLFFFSSPLFDLTLLPVYIITVIKVKLQVWSHIFFFGKQNSSLIWWVYDELFALFVSNNILFVDRCIWCLQTRL